MTLIFGSAQSSKIFLEKFSRNFPKIFWEKFLSLKIFQKFSRKFSKKNFSKKIERLKEKFTLYKTRNIYNIYNI